MDGWMAVQLEMVMLVDNFPVKVCCGYERVRPEDS